MSEIWCRKEGRAGRITLQRPMALNALTEGMLKAIEAALDEWVDDDEVDLVMIDAEGDRAFAAGGESDMTHLPTLVTHMVGHHPVPLHRDSQLFGERRRAAMAQVDDWEALRERARRIKEATLYELDRHLDAFVERGEEAGVQFLGAATLFLCHRDPDVPGIRTFGSYTRHFDQFAQVPLAQVRIVGQDSRTARPENP